MEMLHRPVVGDKFRSEPVEQLRMRRLLTIEAEVFNRRNNRLAEMSQPDVVRGDSRRTRVSGIGDPIGQSSASTCAGFRIRRSDRLVLRVRKSGGINRGGEFLLRLCKFLPGT